MIRTFTLIISLTGILVLWMFSDLNSINRAGSSRNKGRWNAGTEQVCSDCHSDIAGKEQVHQPAKEDCSICHQINLPDHPENNAKGLFLTDSVPSLCFTCHDGVKQETDTMKFVHKAMTESRKCSSCHSPHSSDGKKLINGKEEDLCLSCHNKTVKHPDGSVMVNMKKHLEENKNKHSAMSGGCSSCHKPHASVDNFLLISSFPRERYLKPDRKNFNLCWECHDSDIFDAEQTTTATGFRDGTQNLHRLHLTGARGRSCVICHDVHAAKGKYLILDKVEFGGWTFNMNFVPAENGGSCYPGCHSQKSYVRE